MGWNMIKDNQSIEVLIIKVILILLLYYDQINYIIYINIYQYISIILT